MHDGRELTVLEVLNDNMPFLFDSIMAELGEAGIEVKLVAHPSSRSNAMPKAAS